MRSKITLFTIISVAIFGAVIANRFNKIDLALYYICTTQSGETICLSSGALTTTTTTLGTVPPPCPPHPAWYTTDICTGHTFRAKTSPN